MREIKFRAWDGEIMIYDLSVGNDFLNSKDLKIMQYAGLHDKNGEEIFEGDIIEMNDCIGQVKYVGMAFSYVGKKKDLSKWFDTITNPNIKQDLETEVIGNIYENPDLLKQIYARNNAKS